MQGYNGSQLWDTAFAGQAMLEGGMAEETEFSQCYNNLHEFVRNTQVKEDVPERAKFYRHISKGGWPFSTADHGWPIADCTCEGLKVALGAKRFVAEGHRVRAPVSLMMFLPLPVWLLTCFVTVVLLCCATASPPSATSRTTASLME